MMIWEKSTLHSGLQGRDSSGWVSVEKGGELGQRRGTSAKRKFFYVGELSREKRDTGGGQGIEKNRIRRGVGVLVVFAANAGSHDRTKESLNAEERKVWKKKAKEDTFDPMIRIVTRLPLRYGAIESEEEKKGFGAVSES